MSCIKSLLQRLGSQEAPQSYLNRFTAPSRLAKDSHIAFLKEFLFPHLSLKTKGKYQETISKLINSILNIVDFVNTPVAVLYGEKELNGGSVENDWRVMIEGLVDNLDGLTKSKTKPSETMKNKRLEISGDLDRLQAAFTVQKSLHEIQKENQTLKTDWYTKYLHLAQHIHSLITVQKEPTQLDIHSDFAQILSDYINSWYTYDAEQQEAKEQLEADKISKIVTIHNLYKKEDKLNQAKQSLEETTQKQLTELTQAKQDHQSLESHNTALLQKISSLEETVRKQQEELKQLRQFKELTGEHESRPTAEESAAPPPPPYPSILIKDLIKTFELKFNKTNSSGIKDLILCMNTLNTVQITEFDKLALLSHKMRQIALERKDSAWSKSHFFGKGRHEGVQDLYNVMADKNFSLNDPTTAEHFISMLNDEHRVFTHSLI